MAHRNHTKQSICHLQSISSVVRYSSLCIVTEREFSRKDFLERPGGCRRGPKPAQLPQGKSRRYRRHLFSALRTGLLLMGSQHQNRECDLDLVVLAQTLDGPLYCFTIYDHRELCCLLSNALFGKSPSIAYPRSTNTPPTIPPPSV